MAFTVKILRITGLLVCVWVSLFQNLGIFFVIYIILYNMGPYLSWKKTSGRPLAYVKGGVKDGCIVYVVTDDDEPEEHAAVGYEDIADAVKALKMTTRERSAAIEELTKSLRRNTPPLTDRLIPLYNRLKPEGKPRGLQEIKVDDGVFQILPPKGSGDGKERQISYVAGPSGSGKSYFSAQLAAEYLKLHKGEDRPIYVFSALDEDADSLDKKIGDKLRRIVINDDLVTRPIDYKEFANSLVIFDDVDSISGPQRKAIDLIKDQILTMGRHFSISAICCSHLLADHKSTRLQLAESHVITFFHGSTSPAQLRYCLEKYVGASKDEVKKIAKLKSRSISIFRQYPSVVMYNHGIYLLHQDDSSSGEDEPTEVKKSAKKSKDI